MLGIQKAHSFASRVGTTQTPRVFGPPAGGTGYYGTQAWGYAQVLSLRHWVFIAVKAWMSYVAGGDPPNFGKLVHRDEVEQNPAKFRAVRKHSVGQKGVIRKALGGPQEHQVFEPYDERHAIVRLFHKPNHLDVAYDLWAWTLMFYKLTGVARWWVIRNAERIPVEIWPMPTHWCRLVTDYDGVPSHYVMQNPWGRSQEVPFKDTVQFVEHSPLNRYEGYAVNIATAEWLDTYDSNVRAQLAQYKNGAIPAFHIALGESYTDPDDPALNRLYSEHNSRFQGENNTNKPIITGPDVELKALGINPVDMGYAETDDRYAKNILAAYGVPKASIGLVDEMTYGCLDEKTECLTDRGWKRYTDLNETTRIACYDPDQNVIVYRVPSKIHIYPYRGKMYRWSGERFDALLTPNHRAFVKKRHADVYDLERVDRLPLGSKFHILGAAPAACDVPEATSIDRFGGRYDRKLVGKYEGIDPHLWLEFLGYYIAEGHASKRKNGAACWEIDITQKTDSPLTPKIQDCLDQLPFFRKWRRYNYAGSVCYHWRCSDRGLHKHLVMHCGQGSYNKKIPEYVKAWPAESLRVLLDALIAGDGRKPTISEVSKTKNRSNWRTSYRTASTQLADDVMEIAIKCGLSAHISKAENDIYTVNIMERVEMDVASAQRTEEEYQGTVWCVTVPTGLFVVRRSGKAHITGNSVRAAKALFYDISVNPFLKYAGEKISEEVVKPTPGCEDGCAFWDERSVHDPELLNAELDQDQRNGVRTINEIRAIRGLEPYPDGGKNPVVQGVEMPWVEPVKGDHELDSETAKAMGEGSGLGGGLLVPEEYPHRKGSNPTKELQAAGKWLAEHGLSDQGYGEIFIKENGSGEVWYVGADGDENEFIDLVKSKLGKIVTDDVTVEAEAMPPKDAGWLQVYPEERAWVSSKSLPLRKNTSGQPFTVAVDLHKTLMDTGPTGDDYEHGEPIDGAREAMQAFRDEGYQIIVWTVWDNLDAVRAWLDEHEMEYDFVNRNPTGNNVKRDPEGWCIKVDADAYVDDRGIHFTDWTTAGDEVRRRARAIGKRLGRKRLERNGVH